MKFLLYIILTLVSIEAMGQVKISGDVKDDKGEPISFATVYVEESFEGGSSDIEGNFQFDVKATGSHILVASAVGFETIKQPISIEGKPISVQLTLTSSSQVLNQVVVSAGSFGASDKVKGTMLKPLDIVTNASAQGDIFQAIQTLPGVSRVGNETGLFVRGGDAHETKTIIDGAIVQNPFFSETPNMASRGRFDPFMFKGASFATGGYSSEFGGALSSVLILDTQDIPDNTSSSVGLNMAGLTLSHQQVWDEKTTLMGDISYNNLGLLFNSVPQNVDWVKVPERGSANMAFRHKTKNGMFKSLVQHQRGRIGLNTPNLEEPVNPHSFANENSSTFWNSHYKGTLSKKLGIYAGLTLNQNTDEVTFNKQTLLEESRMLQAKTTFYYDLNDKVALKFGGESFIEEEARRAGIAQKLNDHYSAVYSESDFSLGKRWAFRVGFRAEHSTLLNKMNVAPRTSMAYKTGKNSQVSLAYGHFYQKPEKEFFIGGRQFGPRQFDTDQLDYELSTHLIGNYQWSLDGRSFRVELYDKGYQNLVKIEADGLLSNNGEGYSRGVDVFWKDDKSIRNLDYWVSYSYIDAERDYKNYPIAATPTFITDHTLNIVANYEIEHLGLSPGITYNFATGRRYINPNSEEFLSDKTKAYHNVSLNLSYLTEIFNNFAVLYGSLSNPFGFDQVFGYEYSRDGSRREEVRPTAGRSFFLGMFVNF